MKIVSKLARALAVGGLLALAGTLAGLPLRATAQIPAPLTVNSAGRVITDTLTRPANTTAYAANAAVCGTTTPCAPLTFNGASIAQGSATTIGTVRLVKSTPGATNASFRVWLFQTTPTLTGVNDGSGFGPTWADRNARVGYADCTTPIVSADAAEYECTLPWGLIAAQTAAGSTAVYAVVQALGAYTPGSAEQFMVQIGFLQ